MWFFFLVSAIYMQAVKNKAKERLNKAWQMILKFITDRGIRQLDFWIHNRFLLKKKPNISQLNC